MEKGLIHVYFGNGKGKTTAAVGLAVRAAGRGKRVVFAQFLKGRKTGEVTSLKKCDVRVIRAERDIGFCLDMDEEQLEACRAEHGRLLAEIQEAVFGEECVDMLILDEAIVALNLGVLEEGALKELVLKKPEGLELVLTGGRMLPEWVSEAADYITEMEKQKHPYDRGIDGRKAIEY